MRTECSTCKFFCQAVLTETNEVIEIGLCRRYPPKPDGHVIPNDPEKVKRYIPLFPRTPADQWCGEYQKLQT